MSHPRNRLERFVIGDTKSKSRVTNYVLYRERKEPENVELMKTWARRRRHTTKTCSCPMCGNPRKFFDEKSRQELKYGSGSIYPD